MPIITSSEAEKLSSVGPFRQTPVSPSPSLSELLHRAPPRSEFEFHFGQGADGTRGDAQHDIVTTLEQWVESGTPPATITASGNGMTRPICVWPAIAQFNGGDPKSATSFSCKLPKP